MQLGDQAPLFGIHLAHPLKYLLSLLLLYEHVLPWINYVAFIPAYKRVALKRVFAFHCSKCCLIIINYHCNTTKVY